jgi:hypothetical protein
MDNENMAASITPIWNFLERAFITNPPESSDRILGDGPKNRKTNPRCRSQAIVGKRCIRFADRNYHSMSGISGTVGGSSRSLPSALINVTFFRATIAFVAAFCILTTPSAKPYRRRSSIPVSATGFLRRPPCLPRFPRLPRLCRFPPFP